MTSTDTNSTEHVDQTIDSIKSILIAGNYTDEQGAQEIHGGILPTEVDFLYELIRREGSRSALDIGVARGISFATIRRLCAITVVGVLYGIDPYQSSHHGDFASRLCRKLGLTFNTIFKHKTLYATAMLRDCTESLDFAFIDGWHTFDTTLVDFLLVDDLLSVGGVVGFHDCYYPSKIKVIRFALTHRDYELVREVAVPRFPLHLRAARGLRNVSKGRANAVSYIYWNYSLRTNSSIICLRKRSNKQPPYYFYKPF